MPQRTCRRGTGVKEKPCVETLIGQEAGLRPSERTVQMLRFPLFALDLCLGYAPSFRSVLSPASPESGSRIFSAEKPAQAGELFTGLKMFQDVKHTDRIKGVSIQFPVFDRALEDRDPKDRLRIINNPWV